ncbi:MAG: tetratricopeptide repeat protein [Natronohydrobacter sp.]|nr:tetratricopeptide repeat protein [Natronohydrobacter sp.]
MRGYPTSLMGALRLSYDQLGADAQTIAKLCAYWAPEGLGPWLLLDAPGGQNWGAVLDLIPEPVQALAQDGAQVRAGFTELAARSLLTGTGDARAMHRMSAACLQALDRGELDHGELAPAATALLAAVYPGGDRNPGYSPQWPLSSRLTPHVLALRASTAAPPVAAWDYLLNQAGIYLNAIADYPGYLPLAQENLRVKLARGLPESDRDIAVAHASLGVAHQRLRDWDAAEVELGRALALQQAHRRGSADHADTLDLMGGLMLDLVRDGQRDRLDRAIRLYQQALAIRRRVAGRRSAAMAESLNNLGTARHLQGRGRAAARLMAAALGIRRGVLAPGDARLGTSAVNVGACWLEAGDAARAEPLLREGLDIFETAFAAQPQHPDTRDAAGWLISCLLVRAQGGVNTGARQAEAKRLCAQYGFDYAEMVGHAQNYADTTP